jgi:hypothetical protein
MCGVDNLQLTVPEACFPKDRPKWFRVMVPEDIRINILINRHLIDYNSDALITRIRERYLWAKPSRFPPSPIVI